MSADYFSMLKNDLDITYTDTDEDTKLTNICTRAESYLSRKAGTTLTFTAEMTDQWLLQLLFDCIRYIRSNALDEFEKNYSDDLIMLRLNTHADTIEDDDDDTEG